jgi:hypothetical protein
MLAEDLVRIRRPDERERYAASQRQAKIDPNRRHRSQHLHSPYSSDAYESAK